MKKDNRPLCWCSDENHKCPLKEYSAGGYPIFTPKQNKNVDIIIIGEAPGKFEELKQDFFVGNTGEAVFKYIPRNKAFVTNALLCRGRHNLSEKEKKLAIKACLPRLINDLQDVNQKHVLALGKQALMAITDKKEILNWMGSYVPSTVFPDKQVLCTYHPSYVLKPNNRQWLPFVTTHIKRAWNIARNGNSWKWQETYLEPNREMYVQLKKMLKSKKPVGFDVENFGDPQTATCMCVSLSNEDLSICFPWDGYYAAKDVYSEPLSSYDYGDAILDITKKILEDPQIAKIAQNGQHDVLVMKKYGIFVNGFYWDTLHADRLIHPDVSHKLSTIACKYLQCERWKDIFVEGTDAKGCDAFQKRLPQTLRAYCAKDSGSSVFIAKIQHKIITGKSFPRRLHAA